MEKYLCKAENITLKLLQSATDSKFWELLIRLILKFHDILKIPDKMTNTLIEMIALYFFMPKKACKKT